MNRIFLSRLIAMLLFALFAYTAVSKYLDINNFQASLEDAPFIGTYSIPVSYVLPFLELFIALLLAVPRTRLTGLIASFWLMLLFTLYIGYMVLFTPNLPCSCGGVISEMTWTQHIIFNICFTLLAYAGSWLHKQASPRKTMLYT